MFVELENLEVCCHPVLIIQLSIKGTIGERKISNRIIASGMVSFRWHLAILIKFYIYIYIYISLFLCETGPIAIEKGFSQQNSISSTAPRGEEGNIEDIEVARVIAIADDSFLLRRMESITV